MIIYLARHIFGAPGRSAHIGHYCEQHILAGVGPAQGPAFGMSRGSNMTTGLRTEDIERLLAEFRRESDAALADGLLALNAE